MKCKYEVRKMTPPQIARLWGVGVDKIHDFIRSGQLRAINCATPGRNKRPRYLIDVDDLADFEHRRRVCLERERLGN